MAPIARCDLRLPSDPNDGRRSPHRTNPKSKVATVNDQTSAESPSHTSSEQPVNEAGSGRAPLHAQRSQTRDSAQILEDAPGFSTELTRDSGEVREHKLHEGEAGSGSAPLHAQRSQTRDSAQILEDAQGFSTGLTRDAGEVREHKLHEGEAGSGSAPLHAQRSQTRDSAQILEDAQGFSTGLTRDAGEVREHKLHEGEAAEEGTDSMGGASSAEGADGLGGADSSGGTGSLGESGSLGEDGQLGAGGKVDSAEETGCQTPCALLERNRSEVEASAAVPVDDEDVTSAATAPATDATATPGDVSAQFCENRGESPSSGYNIRKAMFKKKGKKYESIKCKGTYASMETYKGLWGSTKAVGVRKKMELEMRKRRKYLERLHERNKRRRENEQRRAKEKRRMLRCRDQSKIPETVGNISINKAFYFRFNYNQQLPFLPSAMDQHLKRFKRPPFRRYHKGSRPCMKLVDEFEKLRVPDAKTGQKVASRPAGKAKA